MNEGVFGVVDRLRFFPAVVAFPLSIAVDLQGFRCMVLWKVWTGRRCVGRRKVTDHYSPANRFRTFALVGGPFTGAYRRVNGTVAAGQ